MPCSAAASGSRRRSTRRSRSAPSSPGCCSASWSSSSSSTGSCDGCTANAPDSPLFHFNFLFFVGGGALGGAGRQISGARFLLRRDELPDRPQSRRRQPDRRLALFAERGGPDADRRRPGPRSSTPAVRFVFRRRWREAAALPDYWRPTRRQWLALLLADAGPAVRGEPGRRRPRRAQPLQQRHRDLLRARAGDRLRPRRLQPLLLPDRPPAVRRQPPSLCARHPGRRHRPGRARRRFPFLGQHADAANAPSSPPRTGPMSS